MIIWEALQALALAWGEAADGGARLLDHRYRAVFQLAWGARPQWGVDFGALCYFACWRAENVVGHWHNRLPTACAIESLTFECVSDVSGNTDPVLRTGL